MDPLVLKQFTETINAERAKSNRRARVSKSLSDLIIDECNGSLEEFADKVEISVHEIGAYAFCLADMSVETANKISECFGIRLEKMLGIIDENASYDDVTEYIKMYDVYQKYNSMPSHIQEAIDILFKTDNPNPLFTYSGDR